MHTLMVDDVSLDYGSGRGVNHISFNCNSGEILGLSGANGAGKTTLCRLILGFVRARTGSVYIQGADTFLDHARIAQQLSYVPGEVALNTRERAQAYLNYVAKLYKLPASQAAQDIAHLAQVLDLDLSLSIAKMSKGNKQKVALVQAFMTHPTLMILDEPSSGLDPLMQARLIELILAERERGCAIVLSSHIFEEVEKCANSVCFLKDGKLVLREDANQIKAHRKRHADLFLKNASDAQVLVERLYLYATQIHDVKLVGSSIHFDLTGEAGSLLRMLSDFDVLDLKLREANLEETFLDLYSKEPVNE